MKFRTGAQVKGAPVTLCATFHMSVPPSLLFLYNTKGELLPKKKNNNYFMLF